MQSQKNPPINSSVIEYNFSGSGVVAAVQESVNTKTNVNFVHDRDKMGNLIRSGYFLSSRDTNEQVSEIKWFKDGEIEIVKKVSKVGTPRTGRLAVNFTHRKSHEKHSSVLFPIGKTGIRIRFIFRVEKDNTKDFVIMVDIKSLDKGKYIWKEAARYDCAHGYIHGHSFSSKKKESLKEKLPTQNKLKAIKFITNQILKDLRITGIHDVNLSKAKPKVSRVQALDDIRKTEEKMIKLFKSPRMFEQLESTMVAFTEEQTSVVAADTY